jgi:hypothetical protein
MLEEAQPAGIDRGAELAAEGRGEQPARVEPRLDLRHRDVEPGEHLVGGLFQLP